MADVFAFRHGRRHLRDPSLTYPLPVDLTELHRQSLRTLLLMRVFGAPFCSPEFDENPPKKVLELACGSALWSSECHDYFKQQGWKNVSFTGLDIAPLAPDLKQHGMDWRFVQHDLRKLPLPFDEGEFDFVFVKDTVLCAAGVGVQINPLGELMRYVKPGGVIEVWESDLIFRCLLPFPHVAPGASGGDVDQAEETATYTTTSGTGFVKAQNKYLLDYNTWVEKGLDKLKLPAAPCALMGFTFSSEPDLYANVGSRRIAIPFGELRWEREGVPGEGENIKSQGAGNGVSKLSTKKSKARELLKTHLPLTPDQAALRQTALMTVIGLIESLEPMLMKESEKKQDEWDRWWASMTTDLLERNGTQSGECLEVGAWWAQKR
ncbi:hypothetical protein MMC22_010189 [Lobaria immixta]|nr:hypothetical protein [Lobaria immixta]